MTEQKPKNFEATTFNMDMDIKTKAKMYTAKHNQEVREGTKSKKTNLGKLINAALKYYLKDVTFEEGS